MMIYYRHKILKAIVTPALRGGLGSASARLVKDLHDGQTAFRMPAQGGHDKSVSR